MIGEENGWFKININGKQALLVANLYQKVEQQTTISTGGNNKVTADVLRVRTAPNTSSSVSGRVYAGQTLNVIDKKMVR